MKTRKWQDGPDKKMLRQTKADPVGCVQLLADRQSDLGCDRAQAAESKKSGQGQCRCAQRRHQNQPRGEVSGDDKGRKTPQPWSVETYELILAAAEPPKIAKTAAERRRRPDGAPRQ